MTQFLIIGDMDCFGLGLDSALGAGVFLWQSDEPREPNTEPATIGGEEITMGGETVTIQGAE